MGVVLDEWMEGRRRAQESNSLIGSFGSPGAVAGGVDERCDAAHSPQPTVPPAFTAHSLVRGCTLTIAAISRCCVHAVASSTCVLQQLLSSMQTAPPPKKQFQSLTSLTRQSYKQIVTVQLSSAAHQKSTLQHWGPSTLAPPQLIHPHQVASSSCYYSARRSASRAALEASASVVQHTSVPSRCISISTTLLLTSKGPTKHSR